MRAGRCEPTSLGGDKAAARGNKAAARRQCAAGLHVTALPSYAATAGLRGARTAGKSTSVPARLLK